jgi:Uma2 family endonuclease
MSTAITTPVTVEQFVSLDLPESREWELHNGEIVDMGEPSLKHRRLQRQILLILERLFPNADVLVEYPFRIEKSVRSADVGVVMSKDRASDDLLEGAPELVVEVLSPSNTVTALKEYRRLCFAHGTQVFLTVDPDDRTVQVHVKDERDGHTYGAGEQIHIELFGLTVILTIDDIFSDGAVRK